MSLERANGSANDPGVALSAHAGTLARPAQATADRLEPERLQEPEDQRHDEVESRESFEMIEIRQDMEVHT